MLSYDASSLLLGQNFGVADACTWALFSSCEIGELELVLRYYSGLTFILLRRQVSSL